MPTQEQLNAALQAGYTPQQIKLALARAGATQPQKKSVGGFIGNVAKSAVNNVAGIGSALLHPIQTVKGIGNTALGAAQLLVPGEQGSEQYARDLGNFYKQRYGGLSNIGETLYNDPVGVALDASTLLGGAGALAKGAGSVSKVGGLSKLGRGLSRAGSLADPFQLPGRAVGKLNLKNKIGSSIQNIGENMAFSGLHDPKLQKQIKGISGKTPLQLTEQYNTWSRTPESAQKAISAIDELRKSKLVGKSLDIRDIMRDIDKNIAALKNDISDNAQLQRDYLMRKKIDIATALVEEKNGARFTPLQQPAENIVTLRQQIGQDIPDSKWNIGSADSAKGAAAKSVYGTFKDRINTLDPSLKQAGLDESALINMKKLFENEQARQGARNNVSLSDTIVGATTFSTQGLLPAMGAVAAKRLLSTPQAVKMASKGLAGLGKGIQTAKAPAGFSAASGGLYQAGNVGRMVNNPFQRKEPTPLKKDQIKLPQSSPSIAPVKPAPMVTSTIPKVAKEIKYTPPKNVFKNKSSFGKSFKLKGNS